ncbi:LysR family transcriptional regulator [Rhodobacteraceae bacterium MCCB 386]|nr:LysR family transcriptional regulator [Roseitranquillus sediminis]
MDRLTCDRMFVAVMETGSFVRAAERLGTSSGQASKLVSRLEADLGVRLLNRTTRAVSATEAGQAYFEQVGDLLDQWDALDLAVRNISQSPRGLLRLTAPLSFGSLELAPMLNAFAASYPDIRLDVSFTDRLVNVVDEGFDLAIRIGRPSDSSLVARKLSTARLLLVASDAYIAAHGPPVTATDLSRHECILDSNLRDPGRWVFSDMAGGSLAVPVFGRLRFSSADACLSAAEAGLGLAHVPAFVAAPAVRAGAVRVLLGHQASPPLDVHALYPHSRHLAAKVRVLVDFLAARYRGEPPWERGIVSLPYRQQSSASGRD